MQPHWDIKKIEVPITVTLDAYTAGDVVGGLLSCTVPQIKGGGFIQSVLLVDGATQAEPYKLYVFEDAPNTLANDAAFVPTEAAWLAWCGTIQINAADYNTAGTEADAAIVKGIDIKTQDYVTFPYLPDNTLYFYLVADDTPDYAAAVDLTMYVTLFIA